MKLLEKIGKELKKKKQKREEKIIKNLKKKQNQEDREKHIITAIRLKIRQKQKIHQGKIEQQIQKKQEKI